MKLPPFPIDPQTLDMLWDAMFPADDISENTSVYNLLDMISQLGGSDPEAVDEDDEEIVIRNSDNIVVLRDPQYHINDVVAALITEVRRLRV